MKKLPIGIFMLLENVLEFALLSPFSYTHNMSTVFSSPRLELLQDILDGGNWQVSKAKFDANQNTALKAKDHLIS